LQRRDWIRALGGPEPEPALDGERGCQRGAAPRDRGHRRALDRRDPGHQRRPRRGGRDAAHEGALGGGARHRGRAAGRSSSWRAPRETGSGPGRSAGLSRIVVIGGGVIGLAAAWRLAERGHEVTLLERGEPGGEASGVAAGMLAVAAEADPHTLPLASFRRLSAALYPGFARAVERASGMAVGFERTPTLAVGFTAYDIDRLRERERDASA